MKSDTATSDLVAVMALIAVFVTAAAMAGVTLLSYPPGDAAPAMIAHNETVGENVYIYHDGGDPLERGHFAILVDGVDRTENFGLVDASGEDQSPDSDWTSWETGQALVLVPNADVTVSENSHIQIVGEGVSRTGSDWLLHDIGNVTTPEPTGTVPTPTETATPSPTATATPTPVPLVANFTANVTYGPAPLAVAFTDTSAGEPTSWSWDFENDGVVDSTEQNPTFTYTTAGTYTVSLTVTKAETSSTETKIGYINVSSCSSPGLIGTYYPTIDFNGTPVQRVDQRLRFANALAGEWYQYYSDEEDWPIITLNKTEQFSVVYEGYLLVPAEATYTFYLTSDDGSRLWIDAVDEGAEPLIDNWGYHSPEEKNCSIQLSAGPHPIKVKMFENWNAAVLYLEWSSPAFERKPVDSFCQGPTQVSADFTATPLNGTAPVDVQFTDTSTGGATAWAWNFGDNETSTEQNPAHTYAAAGTYTVSLTASNTYSEDTETKTDYITVLAPPVAAFSANVTEGNAPLAVQFTDESTGNVTSWAWDFGDGTTSTEQSPSHTYAAAGIYSVTLNASNAYGYDISAPTTITVLEPPAAAFSAIPTEGNAPLAVQFPDESTGNVTSWAWDFGDGATSTERNPSHTYAAAGTYSVTLNASNAYGFSTKTRTDYITVLNPPAAAFSAIPTEGNAPLAVQFTDESTGNVTSWSWDFGDGNTSTVQNPVHTYESTGNYTVTLNASNAFGASTLTKPDYIRVTEKSFVNFIIDENVFVYGNVLSFSGNNVNGPGATVVITGGLDTNDLNGGASVAVSDIYIDGSVTLDGGSAGLGSSGEPGEIYINGSLTLGTGQRHIYGDVYVAGDFSLKDARIHGDVYVDGDLTLGNTPWIADDAHIFYTGNITSPLDYGSGYDSSIIAKCIHRETVPEVEMPDEEIPTVKSADWYANKTYDPSGDLTSNMKIFADSYSSTSWKPTATNVTIIASTGDITITGMGGSGVTGVFFAPNGKVTFNGQFLEGVVIARDGFFVTSGGTTVTFRNLEEYISDPADYPF